MNHRIGSVVFGVGVGLLVAWWSYAWLTDTSRLEERQAQETAVRAARAMLTERLQLAGLEIVDPLAPERRVGKTYIYPQDDGWEISGYYRRNADDRWHAYLLRLNGSGELAMLRASDDDPALAALADADDLLEIAP